MESAILIVEDHEAVRASLRDWMSTAFPRCRVWEVASGEEAVALAQTHPPHIVLMDIGLPQMNGLEATRQIKAVAPHAQVVIITIYEAADYQTDAIAAGAAAYVTKRTMYLDLLPTIERLLARTSETPNG